MNVGSQPKSRNEGPDNVVGTLLLVLASASFPVAMALGGAGRLPSQTVLGLIGVLAVCGTALKIVEVSEG